MPAKGKIPTGAGPVKKPIKPKPLPRGKSTSVGQRPGVQRGAAPRAGLTQNKPAAKAAAAPNRPGLDKMSVGKAGGKVAFFSNKRGHEMIKGSESEVGRQNATLAYAGGASKFPYASRYKSQFELKGQGKRRGGK